MLFVRLVCRLAALIMLFSSVTAIGQKATAVQRIQGATEASSLDTLVAHPWHAKLVITLFDSAGKNPVDGSIEYWKSGDDRLRVTALGGNTDTRLRHDGKSYHGVSGAPIPYLADALFSTFLHPGPSQTEIDGSTPELQKQNFGKISLDCVMLTRLIKGVVSPLGLFPTYCLDSDADHLRMSYDIGSHQVIIGRIGRFQEHDIAMDLAVRDNQAVLATAKVDALSSFIPTAETFQPAPELKPLGTFDALARISSGVMQGLILKHDQLQYPQEARINHIAGTVVMRAIVDREGHVYALTVISAPHPALAIESVNTVRKWTYRPYLLNGEPTAVDTTVIMNFNLNY